MSKALFDEAIADAKKLREVAEANAKKAIIEAVTPKIRSFIEEQLLEGERKNIDDSKGIMESVSKDMADDSEEYELNETSLKTLLKLVGGDAASNAFNNISTKGAISSALNESLSGLRKDDRDALLRLINKVNNGAEYIINENTNSNTEKENTVMPKNDVFYEIDLAELREAMRDEGAMLDEEEIDITDIAEGDYEGGLEELDIAIRGLPDAGDEEEFDISALSFDELDEEGEEGEEVEEGEFEEEDEFEEEGEEVEVEEEAGEMDKLEEVYDIDPAMLRQELSRLRRLSEGDAKAMAHAFGGGKAGKDPFVNPPNLNVLNEMKRTIKKQRRTNRTLTEKLNKYRGAVETLREQLTDLNLFNAKLLYVNKLLQNKNISTSQRKSIIKSLDGARSLREVKMLYASLTESFVKNTGSTLTESVRRSIGSSRPTRGSSSTSTTSTEVNRWAKLAGIK